MKKKQLLCVLFALVLALGFALPALAAKELIIDDMAKISDNGLAELNRYANEISDEYGMDAAFYLTTNDYAPGQKLSEHTSERWSGIKNGFVLVNDIDGKLWTLVSFGKARQLVTEEVEDRFWAAYNAGDTYYGGVLAYLEAAEEFLGQGGEPPAEGTTLPGPVASILERDPDSFTLLVDEAGLLSDSEAAALLDKLTGLSAKWKNDIVIVTVGSIDGATPEAFADDWFDYGGYGRDGGSDITQGDGLLLLLNMGESDWWISAKGSAVEAFTDAGIEFLGNKLKADGLSGGDYANAFDKFAGWCDQFFEQAATGEPYDKGNLPQARRTAADYIAVLIVCFGAGALIAVFVTRGMKKKLVTVRKKQAAADYVRPGSMRVLYANEQFLYKNVTKVYRQPASSGGGGGSSTHTSSSGSSHGGGGGKF